ncbi:hypothetical protein K9M79_06575 [Candidatus Woesearchaeota archaeon]|nr:hypothetical protein [Candidatus Woesearchaeota archaeon]
MTNINQKVWDYIERHVEIKKTLLNGMINNSALARSIGESEGLSKNIDAVISAIRRYEAKQSIKKPYQNIYGHFRKSTVSTKTNLVSVLLLRDEGIAKDIAGIYSKLRITRSNTFRIFELSNFVKIIMDEDLYSSFRKIFPKKTIQDFEGNLGELTIFYSTDVTKISGVFAMLANEMAMHEVSIIDSMICHREHVIIVNENDLQKAFSVVFNLIK